MKKKTIKLYIVKINLEYRQQLRAHPLNRICFPAEAVQRGKKVEVSESVSRGNTFDNFEKAIARELVDPLCIAIKE